MTHWTEFLYTDIIDPSTGQIMKSFLKYPQDESPDELGSNQDAFMHPERRRRLGYVPHDIGDAFSGAVTTPRCQPEAVVPELSPTTKALRDEISVQVRDLKSPYHPTKRTSLLRREVPRDSPVKDLVVDSSSPSYHL